MLQVYPHGSTDSLPYCTMGSGSLNAMAVFEASYEEDMTQEQAEALVARAIRSGRCPCKASAHVQPAAAMLEQDRPGVTPSPMCYACVSRSCRCPHCGLQWHMGSCGLLVVASGLQGVNHSIMEGASLI